MIYCATTCMYLPDNTKLTVGKRKEDNIKNYQIVIMDYGLYNLKSV